MQIGTPLCVPSRGAFMLGRIASMELNHKPVETARKGDSVAMKIEATSADESAKLYGRHFDFQVGAQAHRRWKRLAHRFLETLGQLTGC